MRSGWWFEDAVAGQTIVHPVARTVGADEHVWLAWMTVNASDLHGNADRAAFGPFGRPVVLGALTVAIVVGLAAPGGPVPPPTVTGRSGWRSIRLGRPVFAGDTLRAVSEVHARRPDGAGGYVERTIRGLSQRDEVVVVIQETCYVEDGLRLGRTAGTKDC
jgi:itaconyl-CoA hydratase